MKPKKTKNLSNTKKIILIVLGCVFVFCCIMFFSSEKNTPEITTKTNYSTVCNSIKTTDESGFSEYKISCECKAIRNDMIFEKSFEINQRYNSEDYKIECDDLCQDICKKEADEYFETK
ncbi:MAG: hypothetical protein ACLRFI_01025 [Alphaproteobacteria bacterium]